MTGYRIWRTADGRYVGDGHLDAVLLAVGPAGPAPDNFDPAAFEQADGTVGPPGAAVVAAIEEPPADVSVEPEKVGDSAEPEKPDNAKPAKPPRVRKSTK